MTPLEYTWDLDFNEKLTVIKTLDFKYVEFTFYSQAPYDQYFFIRSDIKAGGNDKYVEVVPDIPGKYKLKIFKDLPGTYYYTEPIDYFHYMKWSVEWDWEKLTIKVINPLGEAEYFTMISDMGGVAVTRVEADTNSKGTMLVNNYGSGPIWEYDNSSTGGGDGIADGESDNIPIPAIPTISPLSTSMLKMYNPSISELTSFAGFLWSSSFVDAVVKLFQDPMEALIGLAMAYVTPTTGTSEQITIGKITSPVYALPVTNQFITLDCGTINVEKYWGNALDFSPYTKLDIYLPFIGTQTISSDDVMGGTLNVTYNIDLLTGACMCFLTVVKDGLNSVLYSFSGNVVTQIPLSGSNLSSIVSSIVGVAASAGLTIATGGAAAPLVAGTAMSVLNAKAHIQKSGRLDSSVGILGIKKPYLTITRPVQSLAENYNSYRGYPSNITSELSTLSGYTEVETVYMKGITATQDEIDMIENLLKGGVIL